MKPSTQPPEGLFQIITTVKARYVGDVLMALDKKTVAFDISIVKDLHSEKNIPKGSTGNAILEVLSKNKGKMEYKELVAAVTAMGYPKTAFYAAITDLIKKKKQIIRRVNTILIK